MFSDDIMICPTMVIGDIYKEYVAKQKSKNKDNFDGFLYINIHMENTFGN